jgi:hypothetical protein
MVRRLVVAALLVGLFSTVGVNAASARTTTKTWTHTMATGTNSTSTATATWTLTTTPSVQLSLTTGPLATGKCVTVFFDWASSGHHDARALRDCRSNDSVSMTFTEPTPNNITGDPQKLGECFGLDNKKGVCEMATGDTGTIYMDWSIWPDPLRGSPCDESWAKRTQDGALTQFLDPDAMRPTLTLLGVC